MRSLWRRVLDIDPDTTVLEDVEYDEEADGLVAHVRPKARRRQRCGRCGRRSPWYDAGEDRRRWRSLDLGTTPVWFEADAPRVSCKTHGVTVTQVPWARHDARFTRQFDDTVAWLATQCSKTAITELLRIAWRTVGSIITRVIADIDNQVDRLEGLKRIGIDEISYKRGHRYLTIVVDHDTGRLVWAAPGRDKATLRKFFDQVRRDAWNAARDTSGKPGTRRASGEAKMLKHARYALWKNPENLTARQRAKLDWIAKTDPRLLRAYQLKEGLRMVFQIKGEEGKRALDDWISWAQRCRIQPFVALQRRIRKHRVAIDAALEHGLSQGLIESTNTKIRMLTRIAFGFRSPDALIALAMLALGGYRPALPHQQRALAAAA